MLLHLVNYIELCILMSLIQWVIILSHDTFVNKNRYLLKKLKIWQKKQTALIITLHERNESKQTYIDWCAFSVIKRKLLEYQWKPLWMTKIWTKLQFVNFYLWLKTSIQKIITGITLRYILRCYSNKKKTYFFQKALKTIRKNQTKNIFAYQ